MTPPTPREAAVLRCLAAGLTKGESAVALGVSESAVRYHVTNLHAKAGTYTLAGLTARAIAAGWVTVTLDEIGEAA